MGFEMLYDQEHRKMIYEGSYVIETGFLGFLFAAAADASFYRILDALLYISRTLLHLAFKTSVFETPCSVNKPFF
jgi:hypothetical protein